MYMFMAVVACRYLSMHLYVETRGWQALMFSSIAFSQQFSWVAADELERITSAFASLELDLNSGPLCFQDKHLTN